MSTEHPAPPPPLEAPSSKKPPDGQPLPPAAPHLPEDVVVEHILTRIPAAAAIRFRSVCQAWRDALTSDYFVESHRAAMAAAAANTPEIVFFAPAAAHTPEIVFFAPAAAATTVPLYARPPPRTAFYACKLNLNLPAAKNKAEAAAAARAPAARELVTVANLHDGDLAMSGTRPCRGLTLLHSQLDASAPYHVINLSTGEHASLPPCPMPDRYSISSAGLGFDPAANQHKVVRLYTGDGQQLRCDVYGLRSGGGRWRPSAGGQVPPRAARMHPAGGGRPPVFVDGCFYWQVERHGYPHQHEAILSLDVGTEAFALVRAPGLRPVRRVSRLAELDGALCAMVEVDRRLRGAAALRERELWTRAAAAGSWSLRCRVELRRLPRGGGDSLLPLGSSGGRILLATGEHEVYACDLESGGSLEKVFSMEEYVDYWGQPEVLNIALHEESVTGVRRRPAAAPMDGDDDGGGRLKVKIGSSTLARR